MLEEGGKFAAEVTQPLNQIGDEQGCKLDKTTHEVTPPKGFKEAYQQYVEGGWPSLSCDPEYGGQGLPHLVNQAFYEMLNSANQAWSIACLPEPLYHSTPMNNSLSDSSIGVAVPTFHSCAGSATA